jgi:hypothetical protein
MAHLRKLQQTPEACLDREKMFRMEMAVIRGNATADNMNRAHSEKQGGYFLIISEKS